MYVVIMAGGGGTRLRPVSTAERPKPFLPLLPTGETLLQRTVRRLDGLPLDDRDIHVVASAPYVPLIEAQLPGVRVVVEPQGRNTAAAIALATLAIDRDDDDVMVVLPADHRIDEADEGMFCDILAKLAAHVATGFADIASPLVTLGIQVGRPATEYGYLEPDIDGLQKIEGLDVYPLVRFTEKPSLEQAMVLQYTTGVAWNAGMFLWRRAAIREALGRFAPRIVDAISGGLADGNLAAAYASLTARSIDYEVMEPAADKGLVVMGSMNVGWTDVGTWPVLLAVLGASGVEGGVVEAGTTTATAAGDLVIERTPAGLAVREVSQGTITPDRPIALLRGARGARSTVQALLDRCAAAEAGL